MTVTLAVITLACGRGELVRQVAALRRGTLQPDLHVVTVVGSGEGAEDTGDDVQSPWETVVRSVAPAEGEEPISFAHNSGAAEAIARGAQILVFLDGDIIPGEELIRSYASALPEAQVEDPVGVSAGQLHQILQEQTPTLWGGVVAELPEIDGDGDYDLDSLDKGADHHADRPRVKDGDVERSADLTRFDSANFAMLVADFLRVGGFPDDELVGEDSALAETVRQLGGSLVWVGGAIAYRQHVGSS